ncbi:MAG TPA: HAMP domain-containing sensor histidine kinase [Jatrophihabitans sp.]|nr:HAMP domain-containing sensor histidine kinase [Jatrophihabitans sp.]
MSAAPSGVRAGLWQQRRSLRVRLTLLLATLLLLACAAVGVATTLALRTYLVHRFEQQLAAAGARYAGALERNDHDGDNAATATVGQEVGTLGARIEHGAVTSVGVISSPNHPIQVGEADRAVLARLRPMGSSGVVELPSLGEYRVLVTSDDDDGALLVIGLPAHTLEETIRHTVLAETLAFGAVLATMTVLGAFAIRRSLRPLERVASTALRISELPLGSGEVQLADRVPPADEHTEVGQVSVAINHMLERVEGALHERQRSEDRLRQFVADASHELRTPLSVVRSHSELLQRISPDLPEEVRQSLRRIDAEAGRMSSLVNDLLLLARLDSGQPLEHEPVDLTLLAVDAVTDARVAGPDHRWQLDLPEEAVTVVGDQHRLHQVIANLLSNARIHTPAGTTVTVRIDMPSEAEVLLAVHDTGPGIPAELLPTVADRFVRGDGARTRRIASSGLGLSIVAGVVSASGGRLDIASRPGSTTVSVRLPASARPAVRQPAT